MYSFFNTFLKKSDAQGWILGYFSFIFSVKISNQSNPKSITTLEDHRGYDREEIFSKKVKAGKRTYFFDIKSTRGSDYYLTITESKRRMDGENFSYEKHKIFLYKEDFFKFVNALNEAVDHVKNDLLPDFDFEQFENEDSENEVNNELRWE